MPSCIIRFIRIENFMIIGKVFTMEESIMIYVIIGITALITLIAFLFIYHRFLENSCVLSGSGRAKAADDNTWLILLVGVAFSLRVFLSTYYMEDGDMGAFSTWGQEVLNNGIFSFYSRHGATTYPPLYILILTGIAWIRSLFGITSMSVPDIVLLKLPAILFDIIAGIFIYKLSRKKFSQNISLLLASVYFFNPAAITNSALWGQVDSLYAFFIGLTCYLIARKKLKPAYFSFAVAFLLKTQTVIFTPVLIYGIIDQIFLEDFNWKKFRSNLLAGLGAIGMIAVIYFPFLWGQGSATGQFSTSLSSTLGAFPYASVNADNIWTMLGMNWADQSTKVLFLSAKSWGYLAIAALIIGSFLISMKAKKDAAKYPLIGSFIICTMFLFSVRMHERYLFPALILLLITFIMKPNRETFLCFTFFTVCNFINTAYALFVYQPSTFNARNMIPMFNALGMLIAWIFLIKMIRKYYLPKQAQTAVQETSPEPVAEEITAETLQESQPEQDKAQFSFQRSAPKVPFTKKDVLIMLSIMALYSCVALFHLGNSEAPETSFTFNEDNPYILIDLGEEKEISSLSYFLGATNDCPFLLETGNSIGEDSEIESSHSLNMDMVSVFAWGEQALNTKARYIKLTAGFYPSILNELVIKDKDGYIIEPANWGDYNKLFDEQQLCPERSTYMDSTIFDEIYHARTAYEYLNGRTTYETTHPPLGKIFISVGIALFGMNPFGWRIAGTIFGILMLAVIYLFGKRLSGKTWIAAMVCTLFAADFMHFTQTRIATIDVYITFFILCMYYFMFRYCSMSFFDTPLKKTLLPLALCGISMGLGVASKWTGVYAGIGLAIIFFLQLGRRFREYRYAKKEPDGMTDGILHSDVIDLFRKNTLATLGFCILFFIAVPVVIYVLSYIPFVSPNGTTGLIAKLLENQEYMFSYHSNLNATHPYSSSWYEWPMMVKPVLYYSGTIGSDIVEGISAFGNPLVWWVGFAAFFYMGYITWKDRDWKAGFFMIGYLAEYVPWIFVSRYTFIYHYFTCVPFLVLMIGYSIYKLYHRKNTEKEKKQFFIKAVGYCACAVALFFFFYPVLSGYPVGRDFAQTFYCWFKQWYFFV